VILRRPEGAWALYLMAHGAGAGMRHAFLEALSAALAAEGVATLRYEFPYMEAGARRIDPKPVLHARVREAARIALEQGLPLFAGGKSMGGRMTSEAQALEPLAGLRGIAFVGFPLHPAGRPGTSRAEHLAKVQVPLLFLQGTRDELADLELLRPLVEALPRATLLVIDGADHSFQVLKKSGRTGEEVLIELARTFARWARPLATGMCS
jgi:predicted alpha/beta-hydrolase family hydrolase